MPFDTDFKAMTTRDGAPLATTTLKVYKSALNKLAKEGWMNKEQLLERQSAVVKFIDEKMDSNHHKRVVLSAVFKVLADVPHDKQAEYYKLFQSVKTE